ncbi:MAG: shikimate kinase [Flavobacteriales bacterium]|jgi:shikimate kinase
MRIFLLGYMASGKSTLGAALAEALGFAFVDLDGLLEGLLGMPVGEYIEEKGELSFRKAEHEALVSWLEEGPEDAVVALGGGTPVFYDHMALLNEVGRTVFLDVTIGELAQRLKGSTDRPLIKSKEDLVEFVAKHLFERRPYYSHAQVRVKGDAIGVAELREALEL